MRSRYANLERIRRLEPQRDYLEIYQTMLRYEFPWDAQLGLNLAFNRSFSTLRMAALLAATGEITRRTKKRVADTGLLLMEIALNGFDHPHGRDAVRRINQIHRRFDIANDDYLYVLGCLVVVPIRWLDRYAWRPLCCHERDANYHYHRELGRRMNIADIPDSYRAFEDWFDSYDSQQLRYSADAAAIERATRSLMVNRIPKVLAPLGNALVTAMYDDRQRAATGLATPPRLVRAGLHTGLRSRAMLLRWFGTPHATPLFADGFKTSTYPDGYDINQLGPEQAPGGGDDHRG